MFKCYSPVLVHPEPSPPVKQKALYPSQGLCAGKQGRRAGIVNWHCTSTNAEGFGYFSGESSKSPSLFEAAVLAQDTLFI